jgi:hypothetical protein
MQAYNTINRHLILDAEVRLPNNWLEFSNHTLQTDKAAEQLQKEEKTIGWA